MTNDTLDELYRDIILDHYHDPRGRREVFHPDAHSEGKNPSCGDEVDLKLKIREGVLEEVGVQCAGCAISVASGSMLSEVVEGKSIKDVKRIAATVKALLTGEDVPDETVDLGDLEVLRGVRRFPVRVKCALLAWVALIDAVDNYEHSHSHEAENRPRENEERKSEIIL